MITIYHNPRCRKSRAGLEYLKSKTKEIEIVEYLKTPLSSKQLSNLLTLLQKSPEEMIRKQEVIFKSEFKGKSFSITEWIDIMVEHPKLIQRPIIVQDNKAVLGDPVENISEII